MAKVCGCTVHGSLFADVQCSAPGASVINNPDSKVLGANMRPIWGRQDPGGPHVDPINFAIWEEIVLRLQHG